MKLGETLYDFYRFSSIELASNCCRRYRITTNLSARVGGLNPKWNEDPTPEAADRQFQLAMKLVGDEFLDRVSYYNDTWLPAKELVREAVKKRHEVGSNAGSRIISFWQLNLTCEDRNFSSLSAWPVVGVDIFVIIN